MGKKLGILTVRVAGRSWDTKKGSTLDIGGIKREPRPGSRSTSGFTEEMVPSKLEVTLLVGEGDSLTDINKIVGETITAEADTGQTWIIRNAYSTDPAVITEGEGEAKVVFNGESAEEML